MKDDKKIIIGCDISKEKIDIASVTKENNSKKVIILSEKTFPNTLKGYKAIIASYNNFHIVIEATGNYHVKFTDFLEKNNITYSIVNPLIIKRYAQMKMMRFKTDKADARIIALYGIEQNPKSRKALTEVQESLKSLTTVRNNLIKQRTMTSNLLHSQKLLPKADKEAIKAIKAVLRNLNKQIEKIERKMKEVIKEHYENTYRQITSIKGIGEKTAMAIIAYWGDLSGFDSPKQLASFIGITPMIRQSGKSLNKTSGISKRGNARLRTLFYLAALSASKYNIACKEFYERLLEKGKQKKTALIAVVNKLLKQLFAIVKKGGIFINGYNISLDF